jgi:hypothetical protein
MSTLIIFRSKPHEDSELEYSLHNEQQELRVIGEAARFDLQVDFHSTAKDLARQIRAYMESILDKIPEGYILEINARGGSYDKRRYSVAGGGVQEISGEAGKQA